MPLLLKKCFITIMIAITGVASMATSFIVPCWEYNEIEKTGSFQLGGRVPEQSLSLKIIISPDETPEDVGGFRNQIAFYGYLAWTDLHDPQTEAIVLMQVYRIMPVAYMLIHENTFTVSPNDEEKRGLSEIYGDFEMRIGHCRDWPCEQSFVITFARLDDNKSLPLNVDWSILVSIGDPWSSSCTINSSLETIVD